MKEILISLFSGIIGVVLTIGYQHFFSPPQSFTFIYNDEEMVVTKSDYTEIIIENELLKDEVDKLSNNIDDMNIQINNLNDAISTQVIKISELEDEKKRLEKENEQCKNTILDLQSRNNTEMNNNKDDDQYISFLSECEPYYKTPHVYIIDSYIKMCGNTYSNGLNMACDGYYALFNLEGKYNKLRFEVGHIDGTVMSYGEVHIYVDDLKSNPVKVIPIDPEGLVESYEIELNGANQLKIATVSKSTSVGVGIVNMEVQ